MALPLAAAAVSGMDTKKTIVVGVVVLSVAEQQANAKAAKDGAISATELASRQAGLKIKMTEKAIKPKIN